ncbi:MAG TPA: hypothetical protein VMD97_09160 [Candidatus Aquilonibacter sp.]|nr:hypothetical protein [Candidatus Aquilonibacter sp.]
MQDVRMTFCRALGAVILSGGLVLAAGCHSSAQSTGPDPADANMAPASGQTQVLGQSASYTPQQQGESYPQQSPAPVEQAYPQQEYAPDQAEQAGEEAIEEADQPPPPLPDYDQPAAPGPDYIWTPGYWAWGPYGYSWVPGAWVEAPYYGALWTPPWWGYCGSHWCFHNGYWGPHVGYYGGIDYGFGYIGVGYFGGYWNGNHFYYNRAVTHVGGDIHNVYSRPVVYNNVHYSAQPRNRVSYNGGRGGLTARPNASEAAAARERHDAPMPVQRQARVEASQNRAQAFTANHGRPAQAVAAHGFANSHGIAAPPRGVEPGRPNMAAPGRAEPNGAPSRFENRPGQPSAAPNRVENRPGQPAAPNHYENRAQPQPRVENRAQPQPRVENRAQPQSRVENRPQPQPRVENRPQPQPRVENRPQPQPRVENRPQPQRMQAPRPMPQQHAAPRPAPAPHAAPAPHNGGEHPQGGDHDDHGHR